jgi:hypothetical protein
MPAAFGAPFAQDLAASGCLHLGSKSGHFGATAHIRLKSSFWHTNPYLLYWVPGQRVTIIGKK